MFSAMAELLGNAVTSGSTMGNSLHSRGSSEGYLPSPFSLLSNLIVPGEASTSQRSSSCPCRGAAHSGQRLTSTRQRSCSPCCRSSTTSSGSTITVADRVRQRHVANARVNYFETRAAREAARQARGLRPTILVTGTCSYLSIIIKDTQSKLIFS